MLSSIVLSLVFLASAGATQPPFKVIYESPRSPCYTDGKAHQCTPPFTNVAEGIPVVATSTCGVRGHPEEVCKTWSEADGNKRTFCEVCDARNSSASRGADRLTDRHVASNQTCWVSDRVAPGSTVNLSLALGKRFEIFYISLQPCGPLPDSIAIYKSSDFGRSWKPWQYFSSDCYRAFGLPTSSEHNVQISSANIQEVLCVALRPPLNHNSMGQTSNVIAFSTIIGRANSQPWSPALIDWMTMTDLQISLSRFPKKSSASTTAAAATSAKGASSGLRMNRRNKQTPTEAPRTTPTHSADSSTVTLQRRDRSDLYYAPKPTTGPPVFRLGQLEQHARLMQADDTGHPLPTTAVPGGSSSSKPASGEEADDSEKDDEPVRFSFSDIAVGGRCKCNGHANRCVRDRIVETSPGGGEVVRWGPLRCDCQHNTVGADCERCAPGHMDRPWARATAEDANVCKRKHRRFFVVLLSLVGCTTWGWYD
ncbi:Netrin-1 [Sparganum proliferum]